MSAATSSSVVVMETAERSSGHAGAEQRRHAVYGELHHLVDRRHEVEAVLDEEEEHREEHEHEDDLLHARHARVAVHPLRHLDELHGEDEREHPAADGQYRVLPHAAHEVVHGHGARAPEHLLEPGGEDALGPYGLEHVRLAVEDPVARVAQDAAEPRVDVAREVGERGRRECEHERAEEHRGREGRLRSPWIRGGALSAWS